MRQQILPGEVIGFTNSGLRLIQDLRAACDRISERQAQCAGDKLGPYEIVDPLSAGGMGEAGQSRDARLDRLVAIKTSKGAVEMTNERVIMLIEAKIQPHCRAELVEAARQYLPLVQAEPGVEAFYLTVRNGLSGYLT